MNPIQIIECPRDAMQGWKRQIPTKDKIRYINSLLKVGFHTIDFGSFVSPRAIPQMADTKEVLASLELSNTRSSLLAIVANKRGAEEAVAYDEIRYLGFPFSISETFQQRNTNSSIAESFERVKEIQDLCVEKNKPLVIYLSMGFGNPYGDPYSEEILLEWACRMNELEIKILSLADTVGLATPIQVRKALETLIPAYPQSTIGVHLHSTPYNWKEKLEAAVQAGCQRIDGALKGIGGCPMAGDELVGNMNTENILAYLQSQKHNIIIDELALADCIEIANEIFSQT